MAYVNIPGGLWLSHSPFYNGFNSIASGGTFGALLIDATGEKVGIMGPVWFPAGTGTKDIRRVCFRFGSVTKAGGSGLTISLQNPSTASGPPSQPDETQDETVAVANGDASFASNTWYRSGTLSADRTVSCGDDLAIVIEYDGSGRLGSDAVNINTHGVALYQLNTAPVLKTGGAWAISTAAMVQCVLEFSDGTFGTIGGALPMKTLTGVTFNSGSGADELALPIYNAFKCKVNAIQFPVVFANSSSDCEFILYEGTTALQTVTIDANRVGAAAATRLVEASFPATELAASTQYYAAIRPTSANNISAYHIDVDDANHLSVWPGGVNYTYTTRVDSGSWAAHTTTRRLLGSVRLCAIDDGAGGGGGGTTIAGTPMMRGMV